MPYYDSIIEKKARNQLCEVKMKSFTHALVKNHNMLVHMMHKTDQVDLYNVSEKDKSSSCNLIEYIPERSHKSMIVGDLQLSNLIAFLPSFYRDSKWQRLFCLDEDGCSLITFFHSCRDYDTTVLLVEDMDGWKFGGVCHESWKPAYKFFGTGEQMLFTFEGDESEPKIYNW